ncbi:hypothetical protein [Ciceribacter sp. L1K22]|uniref:hypothetical protein n=1 Tax=Ciceribacter sp. L1K22 TaxID=2820275 RepID=UPI001ABEA9AD|nr:hypothetical protein [Ciceribacter sp. L1K22]MBO3759736.1 hypothetical protein [Ciceribacter sp. L1K22]
MADYKLNIDFNADTIKLINDSKHQIVVAKPIGTGDAGNPVWVNINPFEQNKVDWTEGYSIYAGQPNSNQSATTVGTATEPGIDLTPESDLFIA